MAKPDDTIRRLIPFEAHKRNGRPKILPPAKKPPKRGSGSGLTHPARMGRPWSWWRRLGAGEFARRQELAETEGLAERHFSG